MKNDIIKGPQDFMLIKNQPGLDSLWEYTLRINYKKFNMNYMQKSCNRIGKGNKYKKV